jgi:hypothetical protein
MTNEEIELLDKMAIEFAAVEISIAWDSIPADDSKRESIAKHSYLMGLSMLLVRRQFIPEKQPEINLVTIGTELNAVCNRKGCGGTIKSVSPLSEDLLYCTSCDYKSF